MTEFKSIMPILRVADQREVVEFFSIILGFALAWRAGNDGGEDAMLRAGATSLLLSYPISAIGRTLPARCTTTLRAWASCSIG